jgi:hypothetical protein
MTNPACYLPWVIEQRTSLRERTRLVFAFAVLSSGLAGCVARDGTNLRPPPDPLVEFPDAEVTLIRDDRGEIVEPDALPSADVDGGVAADADALPADVDGGSTPVPTYWQDVYPIVFNRCTFCHANEERDRLAGIPPIVTYAHTQAMSPLFAGQSIAERMAARVLNAQGSAGDMPQRGSPFATAMTLAERQTIVRWATGGAPEGQIPDGGVVYPDASVPTDASPLPWVNGAPSSDAGVDGVRYVDVWANLGGDHSVPHTVLGRRTNYNCFVFTVPPHPAGATEEFGIEFTPVLDQRRHVHHMEIYLQDPNNPIDPVGGATPADWRLNTWWDCQGRTSQEQLIANYVPGQPLPIRLPRDTGYRIRPGDRMMLEIHYDSVPPPNLQDMSGLRITTTTTQAGIRNVGEFWVGPVWGYDVAPADNPPNRRLTIESECRITSPVTVFWIRPHMHERGRRQTFWIRRAGGQTVTQMADVNPWDPGNQPLFEVPPAEQQFNVGDVVGTRCEYETEARTIVWGSGGDDEMCFFNMIHYPFTFTQSSCWTRCTQGTGNCPVNVLP